MITLGQLKAKVYYNPATGDFTWWKNLASAVCIGSIENNGYRRIKIEGKRYLAHRLAWFYMTGEWPKKTIDHIDRNRLNNSFSNLREATYSQNKANGGGPLRGVTKVNRNLSKPYKAKICIDGKIRVLGYYKTAEDARLAYLKVARAHFGDFVGA